MQQSLRGFGGRHLQPWTATMSQSGDVWNLLPVSLSQPKFCKSCAIHLKPLRLEENKPA